MQQADFEQAVLRMAQQGGMQRLTPQAVGYRLGMEVKDAERMLDRMVTSARLELDSDDDGNLYYFVPGHGTPGVFTSGVPLDPVPVAQDGASPGAQWGPPPAAQSGATATPGSQPSPGAGQAPWGAWPGQQQPATAGYGTPHPANAPQQSPPPSAGYQTAPPHGAGQYGPQGAAGPYGPPWNPQQPPGGPPPAFGGPAPWGPQAPGGQPPPYGAQPPYGTPYGAPYQAPGAPQYAYGQNALVPSRGPDGPRSPATAALLGLIPGAGQLYNGQVGKGLTLFFLTGFLSAFPPLAIVPWVWGIVDAHSTARRQNQQHYGLLGP